jgi:hypothetical protein
MDKKIKEKWVQALRSGKYKQTKGALRRAGVKAPTDIANGYGNGYCCLGVLCKVVSPKTSWKADSSNPTIRSFLGDNALPPEPVMDKVNLESPTENDIFFGLPSMNDSGKSFSVIADYIEKEL